MAADTRRRRWWASIGVGALLCVGCCVAPLLITAGVAGGGALLVGLSWLEPVGYVLIGLGVAGLIGSRRRSRTRGCGRDCTSVNSGPADRSGTAPSCGCSTSTP